MYIKKEYLYVFWMLVDCKIIELLIFLYLFLDILV